ncbi:Neuronal PAS [Homalodisca vitripennis]|nr:Neuronal PAS [Homalodisca vitripennis]
MASIWKLANSARSMLWREIRYKLYCTSSPPDLCCVLCLLSVLPLIRVEKWVTQSEQDRSCILLLRIQRRTGDWLWVHCVLQVKDNMENSQQPVIVCTNQVLRRHKLFPGHKKPSFGIESETWNRSVPNGSVTLILNQSTSQRVEYVTASDGAVRRCTSHHHSTCRLPHSTAPSRRDRRRFRYIPRRHDTRGNGYDACHRTSVAPEEVDKSVRRSPKTVRVCLLFTSLALYGGRCLTTIHLLSNYQPVIRDAPGVVCLLDKPFRTFGYCPWSGASGVANGGSPRRKVLFNLRVHLWCTSK